MNVKEFKSYIPKFLDNKSYFFTRLGWSCDLYLELISKNLYKKFTLTATQGPSMLLYWYIVKTSEKDSTG